MKYALLVEALHAHETDENRFKVAEMVYRGRGCAKNIKRSAAIVFEHTGIPERCDPYPKVLEELQAKRKKRRLITHETE